MDSKVLQQLAGEIAALRREVNKLKLMEVPAITVWTDWTPTVTQGVGITVTVEYAYYSIIQNVVIVQARLTATSAGSPGLAITIGNIPVTPANTGTLRDVIGTISILDSGTANYQGALVAVNSTTWSSVAHSAGQIGGNPSFTLASNDSIGFMAVYRKA